jgi:long-chain acyl-CoA synthetase
MSGYLDMPEATERTLRGGLLHTGDLGFLDDRGRLTLVDRAKDVIITGGYNVYPREVEEVLYEHPAIAEAAVIGIPHDELGEEICAVVAFKAGQSATEEEIQAHAKGGVAAYKYPRHIVIIDELPKGPTGKIMKREIDLSGVG